MTNLARQEIMQIILIAILLFGGYFYIMSALVKRTVNRSAIPMIAGIVLILYGGIAFFLVMTFRSMDNMGLLLMFLLMMFALVTLGGMVWYLIQNRRYIRKGPLVLFIVYLLTVLSITLLARSSDSSYTNDIYFQPFAPVLEAIEERSWQPLNHTLLNVAMFVPLGFLFPMIDPEELDRLSYTLPVGLMFSTLIESLQLVFRLGQCDIDDIIANTLGALIGFMIFRLVPIHLDD